MYLLGIKQMSNDTQRTRELIDFFIAIGMWVATIYALLVILRSLVIPNFLTYLR
jgi:hypothetical protein